MSDLITRTARLVPYTKRPKQVPSFVTAYSYEPLPDDPGADLGNYYVVVEVLVSGRASEEVADLVIETIGDHYYNQAASAETTPLERFEASIKAANHELSEHVNHGNAAWIGKLSAIVAIQVGEELHIAQTGSAEAFLYRGKASSHISASGPNRPTTPNKTFGSIATGQLEPGDRILLATPALIHQIPLARLQGIISSSGPNAAIAEITELLKGASVDRIAGLVIEATTPELAALQVRSEQPSEIKLGTPDNALEAAKLAAAPIAQTTVESSKKVAQVAQTSWKRAQPHARAASLAAVDFIRRILQSSKGRRITLVVVIVVLITTIFGVWRYHSSAQSTQYFNSYQAAYQKFTEAEQLLANGNKPEAKNAFENAQAQIEALKSHQAAINSKLAHSSLPEAEPKTVAAFTSLISDRIDQIDGLVKVQPTTVASFTAKNARVDHFEINADKAYVIDSGNNNKLSIINLLTGAARDSSANMSKLGGVINTTLSSSNDGIFILTSKPSVWFYRFDTDTVTEQTIAYSGWPTATAIASYASNLYLLGDTAIYKHTKNATGYSPKTEYIKTTSEEARASSGLAVDGSVYLLSQSGLHQYLSSTLKESATTPDALKQIRNLRSTAGGNVLIGTSSDAKRIALWSAKSSLAFSKQIAPSGIKNLYDATYDQKSGNVYALVDGRLVRFQVQP